MIVLVFGFFHMDIRRGGAISVVVVSSRTCRRGRVLYLYVTRTDRNVYACRISHRAEMGDLDRGVIPE